MPTTPQRTASLEALAQLIASLSAVSTRAELARDAARGCLDLLGASAARVSFLHCEPTSGVVVCPDCGGQSTSASHSVICPVARAAEGQAPPNASSWFRFPVTREGITVAVLEIVVAGAEGIGRVLAECLANQSARIAIQRDRDRIRAATQSFVGTFAGELESPINGLRMTLEVIRESATDPELRSFVDSARDSAQRALEVVSIANHWADLVNGRVTTVSREFSLRETLRAALRSTVMLARNHDLDVTCDVLPDVPDVVVGDARRIQQVLNLWLGRALDATPQGDIALAVYARRVVADRVAIEFAVLYSGSAVGEDERAALATARPDVIAAAGSSRALHLAVADGLLAAMNARVEMTAEAGFGARLSFTLTLPIVVEPVNRHDARVAGRHVLVVEPNPRGRRAAEHVLTRLGCEATSAANVAEALESVRRGEECDLLMIADEIAAPEDVAMLATAVPEGGTPLPTPRPCVRASRGSVDDIHDGVIRIAKPLFEPELLAALVEAIDRRHAATEVSGANADDLRPAGVARNVVVAALDEDGPSDTAALLTARGHHVFVTRSIDDTLKRIRGECVDAVVAVTVRPEAGAIALASRLRDLEKSDHRGHLPCFVVTRLLVGGDYEICEKFGVDGCYAASEVPERLFTRLESLVAAGQASPLSGIPSID